MTCLNDKLPCSTSDSMECLLPLVPQVCPLNRGGLRATHLPHPHSSSSMPAASCSLGHTWTHALPCSWHSRAGNVHIHEGQLPHFAIPLFQIKISISQPFMSLYKPGTNPCKFSEIAPTKSNQLCFLPELLLFSNSTLSFC